MDKVWNLIITFGMTKDQFDKWLDQGAWDNAQAALEADMATLEVATKEEEEELQEVDACNRAKVVFEEEQHCREYKVAEATEHAQAERCRILVEQALQAIPELSSKDGTISDKEEGELLNTPSSNKWVLYQDYRTQEIAHNIAANCRKPPHSFLFLYALDLGPADLR